MLRVPPQDSLQVGDILPDESLDFLHVYQACEPQRAIRARLERQVLCRVAELDHGPGIQRRSNAHCVLLPTKVPGYRMLWTDSLRYLRASHTLESSWQGDQEAKGMSVRLGKKQTQNPTIDQERSSCRSARELLLTGSIRRENHQTVTVPGARIFSLGVGAFSSVLRQRAIFSPTITKTPRPESRGNNLRVASVSTNLRGRR